ncbi:MAG TPA: hypothetical protein VGP24_00585 [Glaciihabitans sp.]|jgi:hypothetical protein|nr:hypothetical protein [Glaciihabitans sp.]
MSASLFRDPLWDGATDPTVIRREATADYAAEWWMFYTQRRALLEAEGVEWVHGSRIGVAVSTDGGASWQYRGVVEGLDDQSGNTHWAPEVVRLDGRYHLFLTWIAGAPSRWEGHPRRIIQFVSDDLEKWDRVGELELSSDLVIDAAVARTADGLLRLWYKDEADDSTTYSAVSETGEMWRVEGKVIGGRPHEGPNVFELAGWFWMIVDEWRGQGVYRSVDGCEWVRQGVDDGLILNRPGVAEDDQQVGRHADVVVDPDTGAAWVFYFTHPNWDGVELDRVSGEAERRSVIQVARLEVETLENGVPVLLARRDLPSGTRLFG